MTIGQLCISLDFELMWGVHDVQSVEGYGPRILGVREAIPAMLALFEEYGLHASWATVGMLACQSKDELIALMPEHLPAYNDPRLSTYSYVDEVGANETADPFHFGGSLLAQILQTPGQEVASHSFSHFYCCEQGASEASFEADITACKKVFANYGVSPESFVFPRNQFSGEHAALLARHGITNIRGNETHWAYDMSATNPNSVIKRAFRLADSFINLSGANGQQVLPLENGARNVPASRFLRPYSAQLSALEPLKLRRIKGAMTQAAKRGELFHLWWHPHNFGFNLAENMKTLREIALHYQTLKDTHGMRSVTMREAS